MRVVLLSLAACQQERGLITPGHLAWFTFTPEDNSVYLQDEIKLRTESIYPKHRNWSALPGRKIELGIEWIYTILLGNGGLSVFGLSLIAARVVGRALDIQHRPMMTLAKNQMDAVQQGVRQARLEWPEYQKWGVKAVLLDRDWFRLEMDFFDRTGILQTREANNVAMV